MPYLGDIRVGATIYGQFNTRDATGAPATFSGSPAILVYKDSTTESASTGITLTVDYDSRTGLNNFSIDTSANSSFFVTGKNYNIVVTSGTSGGISVVGAVVATFSIENRSALMPTTSGRTLAVDAAGLADANTVKIGPTGSGTAQTARDLGASVLLSSGTGTGQLKLASGYVALTWADIAATTSTVNFSNTTIGTVSSTLAVPNVTLSSSGLDNISSWTVDINGSVNNVLGDVGGVAGTLSVNVSSWGSTNVGGMPMPTYTQPTGFLAATFPATVASPTNITAGTITTVTNLTNAATNGDLTSTMKTSVTNAVPTAAANATATWAAGTRTLTGFGTLVADIWANTSRTLTDISAALLALLFTRDTGKTYGTDAVAGSVVKEIADNAAGSGGGGSGSGANAVTVTVVDDDTSAAIGYAFVRFGTFTSTANASGVATFSLDDANYLASTTDPNSAYQYTPATKAVDATHKTFTLRMTPKDIVTPTAGTCTGVLLCTDNHGQPAPGIVVTFQAIKAGSVDGFNFNTDTFTYTTGADGLAYANPLPAGGIQYRYRRGDGPWVHFLTGTVDTVFDIDSGVGSP